jgi:STE20-like kinase
LLSDILFFRTGTTGSRSSRKSDSVIDVEDNEVVLRSKPSSGRSLSTVSNGTTMNSEADTTSEREPTPVRRAPRTKEEIELSNLKKKTRKRTRRFEVDGVVVTTTTNKVHIPMDFFVTILRSCFFIILLSPLAI